MQHDLAPRRSGNSAGQSFPVRCPNGGTRLGKGCSAAYNRLKIGLPLPRAGAGRSEACQIRQVREKLATS
jgi:hypothetical protein